MKFQCIQVSMKLQECAYMQHHATFSNGGLKIAAQYSILKQLLLPVNSLQFNLLPHTRFKTRFAD